MTPQDLPVPVDALLSAMGLVGIFVFAASGALAAARLGQTLVTFAFFAIATGVGGGTVRDLLIGAPVFWIHDVRPALICLGASLVVWMTPERWWSERALDWLDAVGLVAFAVFGTAKAMSLDIPPFISALMGIITACVGGIIRDLLAGHPSIVLRPEIYVTAAALSAGLYALLASIGMAAPWAAVLAVIAGFILRAVAIVRGLALPHYRTGISPDQAGGPSG
ncbi:MULTISPECIES: trimeric intracellular cation channel family protein [unclassified Sphingobium]|uniref:trimeric intracellular cation channel family protein n=1 Tax=unclassified Sphingobium TaxID=2611147 RepID=UPI00222531AE|nr:MULTISPECIES: trimeric intracellular cation channel family protein [unclassified Sphingobium]MCW2364846.1 putative membrane protein YeiH [Sphingobium sp. B7D2B]MCW2383447.1 putative membrane protein YeiH [Sphingobium sp. B2D3B]MCW2399578.1 putative membrane protein YeiH [Sphingobium sp. B2D3C]